MRFLILFLLFSSTCFGQTVLEKQVIIERKEGTTGDFLNDLVTRHGIALSYSSGVIDLSRKVHLTGKENTIHDILLTILKGQPVKITERDGKIFLLPADPPKKKITISGYITEKKSGERLIGASVYIPGKNRGTTSNSYGFYSLTLEEDTVSFEVTHTGYTGYSTRLELGSDMVVDVSLEPNVVVSEIVVVNSDGKRGIHNRTIGKTEMTTSIIKSVPSLFGEPDVMRSLQLLPGVQGGNEGSSGLHVRGGSTDQNLILLDGVPVYNTAHAFGMFSVFNADAVNHVEVLKGAFPASYGGRLSSVIDVHMKEGDKQDFHGEGGLGVLFSKLTFEGPIKKGKSSFMISGRRTYLDLLLKPFFNASSSTTELVPYFSDINLKANFPAGKKDHFYFSFYTGKDKLHIRDQYRLGFDTVSADQIYTAGFSWGNITSMARWNHIFSKKVFSNFTFTHSRYEFNLKNDEERLTDEKELTFQSKQRYFSGINDWNFRSDFDYFPAPSHFVKGGFSATLHRYLPGINTFFQKDSVVRVDSKVDNHSVSSGEFDLYIEDDFRISHTMKLNLGARLSMFAVNDKSFTSFQPRINWLYRPGNKISIKASYGYMSQFIHLLTNSNLGLPTDLWLPVTSRVPPQSSNQFSAGTYYHNGSLDASVEVYYKSLNNVIEYVEGVGFGNAYDDWEDLVETGKGKSYGIEWLVQKSKGKVTGLISYTLGKSTRTFKNINEGKTFPYKYDRRHEGKLAIIWKPKESFELSSNWIYATGNAISLPVAYYQDPYNYSFVDIYEGRNNFRMPDYHRLDVSVKFIKQRKKYQRSWVLSVYNVYNKFNPYFRYKEYTLDNEIVFKDMSVFPIVPSFSYQIKF